VSQLHVVPRGSRYEVSTLRANAILLLRRSEWWRVWLYKPFRLQCHIWSLVDIVVTLVIATPMSRHFGSSQTSVVSND
jgi:hypothetical protein